MGFSLNMMLNPVINTMSRPVQSGRLYTQGPGLEKYSRDLMKEEYPGR